MRKWCATVAMGALFALPLCAQQKDASATNSPNEKSEKPVSPNASTSDFGIAPGSRMLFAMPSAAPSPADIFSDWENNHWNRHAWGRLTPRYELAGLFSYINFNPGSGFHSWNNYGATGSFAYNATSWLGLVAEVGGYHFTRGVPIPPPSGSWQELSGGWQTYLFGPRVNFRKFDHFVPFLEFMAGGAHAPSQLTGTTSKNTFAAEVGGGIDVTLMKNLAWRFVEADYLITNFDDILLNPEGRQNNFKVGSGLVLRWGYPPAPPKPNHPPVASCAAEKPSVYQGSNEAVGIHVNASDADNDPLTYSYTATGGTVEGTGADARWNPSGLAIGSYTVNAKVDDGRGGTATCSADVAVEKRPNRPPTISCAPERNPIIAGERVAINSTASDPDGDPITYSYSATGGQISGTGQTAQFDSTGLSAGSYTITCTADDGQGGRTSATTTVDVQKPAPPPQATKVGDCGYRAAGSSRVDNECKRVLDDVALRLKNEPNAKLVVVGYADKREPGAKALGQKRADLVRKYLGEKGIDASRIETRTGTPSTEKGSEKANRRIETIFVPEGATY